MQVYNKLVRDRVPEIIRNSGKIPVTKKLSEQEYLLQLREKSKEEMQEYLNARTDQEALEELADLLEIRHTLAPVHGSTFEEVESLRRKKEKERGGFRGRILLIEVQDE